jgi:hypothetical protein
LGRAGNHPEQIESRAADDDRVEMQPSFHQEPIEARQYVARVHGISLTDTTPAGKQPKSKCRDDLPVNHQGKGLTVRQMFRWVSEKTARRWQSANPGALIWENR